MNGFEYLMHPNLDRSQDEEMGKMDKSGRMPASLIPDKYTGFQTCNVTLAPGVTYSNTPFQFDLNRNYDFVVGIGILVNHSELYQEALRCHFQINNSAGTIISKTSITSLLSNPNYISKNGIYMPIFFPANGEKLEIVIDALNSFSSELNFQFILMLKNNVLPYPFELDFFTQTIILDDASGSYSVPSYQKKDLLPIPSSFNEIVGIGISAFGGIDKASSLYESDFSLYYKDVPIFDYLPMPMLFPCSVWTNKYNYVYSNTSFSDRFYKLFVNKINSKILTANFKHYQNVSEGVYNKYQDITFLVRRKAQRYL